MLNVLKIIQYNLELRWPIYLARCYGNNAKSVAFGTGKI